MSIVYWLTNIGTVQCYLLSLCDPESLCDKEALRDSARISFWDCNCCCRCSALWRSASVAGGETPASVATRLNWGTSWSSTRTWTFTMLAKPVVVDGLVVKDSEWNVCWKGITAKQWFQQLRILRVHATARRSWGRVIWLTLWPKGTIFGIHNSGCTPDPLLILLHTGLFFSTSHLSLFLIQG